MHARLCICPGLRLAQRRSRRGLRRRGRGLCQLYRWFALRDLIRALPPKPPLCHVRPLGS